MRKILGLLCIVVMLFACADKHAEMVKINPKFTTYITGFTSGVVSNKSEIRIEFREALDSVALNNNTDEIQLSFIPEIKGRTYWLDDHTLSFKPDTILNPNQLFKGSLKLNFLKDIPAELSTFEFNFQTRPLFLSLINKGISPYNNEDMTWQRLNGQLESSDYIPTQLLDQCLQLKGLKGQLKWSSNSEGTQHEFVVDSIERTAEAQHFYFEINGASVQADQKEEIPGEIPALGDFKLMEKFAYQAPQQHVSLIFSDPVSLDQDLNGLIYLNNGYSVQIVKNGNELKVYPSSRLEGEITVSIDQSIKNIAGYQLQEGYSTTLNFSSILPAVELIGDGTILPFTDGVHFPFKAVNLQAVTMRVLKVYENNALQFFQDNNYDGYSRMKRVARLIAKKDIPLNTGEPIDLGAWNTFAIDLSDHIKIEPGCVYRIQLSFDQSQSLFPCGNATENTEIATDLGIKNEEDLFYDEEESRWSYYGNPFFQSYSNYNWRDRDNPCTPSYYMNEDRKVSKNIIASNLGIIAKGNDRFQYKVFITDLLNANTLSGVKVDMYNYQQQVIASGVTNNDGEVNFDLKGKPFICVASKDGQKGYLKLADGNALSTSMFDVNGTHDEYGIKAYLYGERGVWRPGDSLFISCVIQDLENVLPANHPIVYELEDARGNLKERKVQHYQKGQILSFKSSTDLEDPTGNWIARVKIGGNTYTRSLKIENIKPNRLKIKVDFTDEVLQANQTQNATIELKWLHGAVAKNLRTDVEARLVSGHTQFKDYKDFSFDDPSKYFSSSEEIIFDGLVDAQGKVNFNTNFQVEDNAPGMLRAKFKVRAFEKSGDFSINQFVKDISPYDNYVGIKVPKGNGWRGAISTDEKHVVSLVNVDKNGTATPASNIKIEIYKLDWRWWWERNQDDYLAHYINNQSQYLIYDETVSIGNKATLHELKFDKNYWGRAYVRVYNPQTGHSSGQLIYLDYSSWWNDPNGEKPGGAEMLNFDFEKENYEVGEDISFSFPSNEKGKALVSLENGSSIVETFWVDCEKGNTKVSFPATADMVPNVYVNIAFIQPHENTENDLPLRMYGISSVNINDPKTHLTPTITMPDVLAPEQDVTIKVKENTGQKMSFTLAMVDEGILDLTNFKTPNPHSFFYQKEALGIRSWDMFKHVMGAFNGSFSALLALGGDEALSGDGKKKVNRFKPVVKFYGPFELDANEKAYGSAEKTTPVRKPLMVLTTLPRVLGPGEKVSVPITIFAMEDNIKNVNVSLKANDLFNIIGESSKKITFSETGDQVVFFDLEVKRKVGVGSVEVEVTSGKHVAKDKVELNVRVANPRITEQDYFMLEGTDGKSVVYEQFGVSGSNEVNIELSSLPAIKLSDRLEYLVQYPHGCVEQTTSSVFPQLYLTHILTLDEEMKSKIKSNIVAGIKRLSSFQQHDGGLSYWPGSYRNSNDWGTSYAGHFLMEAEKLGYALPLGFKDKWLAYQKKVANSWRRSEYHYSDNSQAYRLYTLALAGKPALGAMNRLKNDGQLNLTAKWRLAAAYALAGKTKIAEEMVDGLTYQVEDYQEMSYNFGSGWRDRAMILETMILLGKKEEANFLMKTIADRLNAQRWMNTQETAYSLVAIGKFIKNNKLSDQLNAMIKINGELVEVKASQAIYMYQVDLKKHPKGDIHIQNLSESALFVNVNRVGIPLENNVKTQSNRLNMKVEYFSLSGTPIDISSLPQGTDFKAVVNLRIPYYEYPYRDLALTQIFPSGWEIRNKRMENVEEESDGIDYQDIKDDRVLTYFNLNYNQNQRIEVTLHAAYPGKYYLPAVYAESMYDHLINAVQAGQWIEVKSAE